MLQSRIDIDNGLLRLSDEDSIGQTGPGSGYAKIPRGAYSIIAEVHAEPGKREELRAATLPLISLVRSDPKNLPSPNLEPWTQNSEQFFYHRRKERCRRPMFL